MVCVYQCCWGIVAVLTSLLFEYLVGFTTTKLVQRDMTCILGNFLGLDGVRAITSGLKYVPNVQSLSMKRTSILAPFRFM